MRNSLVAVIGVLTVALFAGSSFATAPVAQDIPDFKLLTGSETVNDFDLNGYVTDFDTPVNSLSWTIDGFAGFDGTGNPASLTGSLVDIAGKSSPTQGTVSFKVADASESSVDTSTVKYSSLLITGPSLTQDNQLLPPNAFTRTWVVEGDRASTTPVISSLISPSSAQGATLSVSIADLNGDLQAGANTATAEFEELSASINGEGKLVLAPPAGKYPTTGFLQLSGAYRVGVKAKLTGGGLADADDNWDGMELFVSNARYPNRDDQPTLARLDRFNNLEITATLPQDLLALAAMRSAADESNPRWCYTQKGAGTTANVVASTDVPASAWATSGNALHVQLPASGQVKLQSQWFTDIAPGETVTVQANITTSALTGQKTPLIKMFMGNAHMNSNNSGVVLPSGTATADQGSNGWKTIKLVFTADTFGAAVASTGGPVDFYQLGYAINFALAQPAGNGVDIYIDNIRVYRDENPMDRALAATQLSVVKQTPNTEYFDGKLEAGTTLAACNLFEKTGADDGEAVIDTAGNNMTSHDGDNSLRIYIPGAAARDKATASLKEYVFTVVRPDATTAGGANNEGAGIYGLSFWFKTDAADVASCPSVRSMFADNSFAKDISFSVDGLVGCPLNGQGWKNVRMATARRVNVDGAVKNLQVAFVVLAGPAYSGATIRSYWGEFTDPAKVPGYECDANIFIDDIQIHKIMDSSVYFDRSIFPAVD